MEDQPGTHEEWRVTGNPGRGYEPYSYTWSRLRQPGLVDPEGAARRFVADIRQGDAWADGPHLYQRTVVVTEWREATT